MFRKFIVRRHDSVDWWHVEPTILVRGPGSRLWFRHGYRWLKETGILQAAMFDMGMVPMVDCAQDGKRRDRFTLTKIASQRTR